jgi:flagellar basal-body rod protein FlgG
MKAQMTNLDVISNNLANANTVGFKKSRADFQDLLYQAFKAPGARTSADSLHPVGQEVGVGTKLAAVTKQFVVGSLTRTDRDLDIAIAGNGFIPVTDASGNTAYTRDGSLKLTQDGQIVNSDGMRVSTLGAIPSNARSIGFSQTGEVSYMDENGDETSVGNIELAMFVNPSGLHSMGGNLYQETPASGSAGLVTPGLEGSGTLQQHVLELSNVSIVEEMVNMITAQRAYEVNSKVIKSADEMLSTATNLTR